MSDSESQKRECGFLLLVLLNSGCFVIATYLIGAMCTISNRPAAFVISLPVIGMLLACHVWGQSRAGLIAFFTSFALFIPIAELIRRFIDPAAFFGPFEGPMLVLVYGIIAAVTLTVSLISRFVFRSTFKWRFARWPVAVLLAVIPGILGLMVKQNTIGLGPHNLLANIHRLETDPPSRYVQQELGSMLGASGRDTEAEGMSQFVYEGNANARPIIRNIDVSKLEPLDWQAELAQIAKQQQVVIFMEAHDSAKHRQVIEQAIPILHSEGFRDYAGETFHPSIQSVSIRGFPSILSGYYLRDPSFGNAVRRAIELDFSFHPYESYSEMQDSRERGQASNLAKLLPKGSDRKLLVHAGYAHVYKTPSELGDKTMAAYLWEMSGIEPFSIYQTHHGTDRHDAKQLAKLIGPDNSPIMIRPVSDELCRQLNVPKGAIDAVIVHPASSGGPAERTHLFPESRQKIEGRWQGNQWPIMIAAYKLGESDDAVALDQVMLRANERDFVLWTPKVEFEVRVFGLSGRMNRVRRDGKELVQLSAGG